MTDNEIQLWEIYAGLAMNSELQMEGANYVTRNEFPKMASRCFDAAEAMIEERRYRLKTKQEKKTNAFDPA